MTSSSSPHQNRARRTPDALSLFLVVAMGTLLLMYLIDSGRQDIITEQRQRATSLHRDLLSELPSDCLVEAAGPQGATLLIRCLELDAAQLRDHLETSHATLPSWVEAIALRDASRTLMCSPSLSSCQPHTLPSNDQLADSRRRAPR